MGKNRRSASSPSKTYKTGVGEIVDAGDKSEEWMKNFEKHLSDWIMYGDETPGDTVSAHLTNDEIKFIKEHMINSGNDSEVENGVLTRFERAYHLKDLEVGDDVPTNTTFRAFSRTRESTAELIGTKFDQTDMAVVRTKNVPSYNITKYDDAYFAERESLVSMENMKLISKKTMKMSDFSDVEDFYTAVTQELDAPMEYYDWTFDEITFYDIAPK